MPTYRRPDLLPRALESIARQTMASWEALVIDDEPSDTTRAIVDSCRDGRIRYVVNGREQGASGARNTGVMQARGEYLAFLDDDDEYLPTKLELQATLLDERPDVDVVICHEFEVGASGSRRLRAIDLNGDVLDLLLSYDVVHPQMLMVRRAALFVAGLFDQQLAVHEDYELSLRLAARYRFATVPEPLIVRHTEPSDLSRDLTARVAAIARIIETHPEIRRSRRLHSHWLVRTARIEAQQGHRAEWRKTLRHALVRNPLNLKAIGAYLVGPTRHVALAKGRGRRDILARRRSARSES